MTVELTANAYLAQNPKAGVFGRRVALEDLVFTTDMPTTGGSRMLEDYKSLFAATVADRLTAAGWTITGKVNAGEFGVDLLGETSAAGAVTDAASNLAGAGAMLLRDLATDAVVGLDVNGAARRAAALAGQVCLKPTYGVVSRFGTIAVACSGEAVSVAATDAATVGEVLDVIAAHDDNDGTALPPELCARVTADGFAAGAARDEAFAAPITHVVLARGLYNTADADTRALMDAAVAALRAQGITVTDAAPETDELLAVAHVAWNILMSAELCNNVSRFDGVKYGYRSADFMSIGELYTNSRTEAFGALLKSLILYGSDVLSTDKYDACYDKALRVRRLLCEALEREFAQAGASADAGAGKCGEGCEGKTAGQVAILLPACAKRAYTPADVAANPSLALEENRFTAPASVTGFPSLVAGGVQLIGNAYADRALLALAGAGAAHGEGAGTTAGDTAAPTTAQGEEVAR